MRAFKAGRIFDGRGLLPQGSAVLVDQGRILEVLAPEATLPDGCEVAEFSSSTLLPGLIDTHVHLCTDSAMGALERIAGFSEEEMTAVIERGLRAQLAAGVTSVRDLGDRRWAVIDWRDRNGRHAALPTVVGSGPPITLPGGHCWNMGGAARGVKALCAFVRAGAEHGVDIVKVMASGGVNTPGSDASRPQFTVEELKAVVTEAHAVGLPVTAHAHALDAIRNALAAGVDAIEHCTFITKNGIEIDQSVVTALADSGILVCPTLGYAPGAQIPPLVLEMMRRTGLDREGHAQAAAGLYRAGVRLVSGSDSGISPAKRHGVLPESLIQLADGGVPSADVLTSATAVAAEACGLSDRKGRVLAGLEADLLVVDGDPLTDITTMRNVEAVFLRGQRVV